MDVKYNKDSKLIFFGGECQQTCTEPSFFTSNLQSFWDRGSTSVVVSMLLVRGECWIHLLLPCDQSTHNIADHSLLSDVVVVVVVVVID